MSTIEYIHKVTQKTFHMVNAFDHNDQATFTQGIPAGLSKAREELLILRAALERLGWDGPYEGEGNDTL